MVAAAFALAIGACETPPAAPRGTDAPLLAAFDSVWHRYDKAYPYFEYKQIDWQAAWDSFRPRAAEATTPAELAAIVREMLAGLRDVHSSMTDPSGRWVPTYTPTAFVNWQRSVWSSYMAQVGLVSRAGDWGTGRLGSVPYLYFGSWQGGAFTVAAVDSALETIRDAPAVIIDVRMNGGGSNDLAYGVAARFFDQPRSVGSVQFRAGPSHDEFTSPIVTRLAPRGVWQFRRPVLVLTGRAVFSSAENFVMAMRVLPHVTVAGDTTGGGSGNPTQFFLPGGWRYNLPRWIERTPEGDVVEWRGLAPSVLVPASAGDFDAGRDPVLDYAAGWAAAAAVRRP